MNAYKEIGKRIGQVLEDMGVSEITVTKISVLKQALQGRLDLEIMLHGKILFHFKNITEEQRESMFTGLLLIYTGEMTLRHNLPILTATNEGNVRFQDTSIHSAQQFKTRVEKEDYAKIIKHENVFQITPTVVPILMKHVQKQYEKTSH